MTPKSNEKTFFHSVRVQMQSIKTKLKVNNQQKTILAKHAGVAPDCL